MAMESDSVDNIYGYLYFYRKKGGLTPPYPLSYGRTTLGSSHTCNIRIKEEGDIFCSLDSNEAGVTILINELVDDRITHNGEKVEKFAVLRDGDHFQLGGKKFKYSNLVVKEVDLNIIEQTIAQNPEIKSRRQSRRKSGSVNNFPIKRLNTVAPSPIKRRFSTGSKIGEVKKVPNISARNVMLSLCTSTPQSASKVRFSQRMAKARDSSLSTLKENKMVNFVSTPAKNKTISNLMELKGVGKSPTPRKNKTFTGNLKELDLNCESSCASPVKTGRRMYSGNLSDASKTTPENSISVASITPLNVSKKTTKTLEKSKNFSYIEVSSETSTPKSAIKGRRSSSIYRPVVEEITPVSPLPRSSMRNSLKKIAFTQRRSVNFNISSSSESAGTLEEPDFLDQSAVSTKAIKRKRSLSDTLDLNNKKVAKRNTLLASFQEEIDEDSYLGNDSSYLGVDPMSDTSSIDLALDQTPVRSTRRKSKNLDTPNNLSSVSSKTRSESRNEGVQNDSKNTSIKEKTPNKSLVKTRESETFNLLDISHGSSIAENAQSSPKSTRKSALSTSIKSSKLNLSSKSNAKSPYIDNITINSNRSARIVASMDESVRSSKSELKRLSRDSVNSSVLVNAPDEVLSSVDLSSDDSQELVDLEDSMLSSSKSYRKSSKLDFSTKSNATLPDVNTSKNRSTRSSRILASIYGEESSDDHSGVNNQEVKTNRRSSPSKRQSSAKTPKSEERNSMSRISSNDSLADDEAPNLNGSNASTSAAKKRSRSVSARSSRLDISTKSDIAEANRSKSSSRASNAQLSNSLRRSVLNRSLSASVRHSRLNSSTKSIAADVNRSKRFSRVPASLDDSIQSSDSGRSLKNDVFSTDEESSYLEGKELNSSKKRTSLDGNRSKRLSRVPASLDDSIDSSKSGHSLKNDKSQDVASADEEALYLERKESPLNSSNKRTSLGANRSSRLSRVPASLDDSISSSKSGRSLKNARPQDAASTDEEASYLEMKESSLNSSKKRTSLNANRSNRLSKVPSSLDDSIDSSKSGRSLENARPQDVASTDEETSYLERKESSLNSSEKRTSLDMNRSKRLSRAPASLHDSMDSSKSGRSQRNDRSQNASSQQERRESSLNSSKRRTSVQTPRKSSPSKRYSSKESPKGSTRTSSDDSQEIDVDAADINDSNISSSKSYRKSEGNRPLSASRRSSKLDSSTKSNTTMNGSRSSTRQLSETVGSSRSVRSTRFDNSLNASTEENVEELNRTGSSEDSLNFSKGNSSTAKAPRASSTSTRYSSKGVTKTSSDDSLEIGDGAADANDTKMSTSRSYRKSEGYRSLSASGRSLKLISSTKSNAAMPESNTSMNLSKRSSRTLSETRFSTRSERSVKFDNNEDAGSPNASSEDLLNVSERNNSPVKRSRTSSASKKARTPQTETDPTRTTSDEDTNEFGGADNRVSSGKTPRKSNVSTRSIRLDETQQNNVSSRSSYLRTFSDKMDDSESSLNSGRLETDGNEGTTSSDSFSFALGVGETPMDKSNVSRRASRTKTIQESFLDDSLDITDNEMKVASTPLVPRKKSLLKTPGSVIVVDSPSYSANISRRSGTLVGDDSRKSVTFVGLAEASARSSHSVSTKTKRSLSTDNLQNSKYNSSNRSTPTGTTKSIVSSKRSLPGTPSNASALKRSMSARSFDESAGKMSPTSSEASKISNIISYSFIDSSTDGYTSDFTDSSVRKSRRTPRSCIDEHVYEVPKRRSKSASNLDSFTAQTPEKSLMSPRVSKSSDVKETEAVFSEFLSPAQVSLRNKTPRRSSTRIEHVIFSPKSPKVDPSDISQTEHLLETSQVANAPERSAVEEPTVTISVSSRTPKQPKSPKNDLTNIVGVKKLLQTPKVPKSPVNDLTNITGVKKLMKTPRAPKSPNNDLTNIVGVKKLLGTPKAQNSPKNDLTNIIGVKTLMKTPKVPNSPKNDLRNIAGVKKLMKTPKVPNSPKNDLSNIAGVKKLMKTPKVQNSPKNDLTNIAGVKKLMETPEVTNSPKNDLTQIAGVKKLMATPKVQNSPKNDLTNVAGVKKLMRTPKEQKEPENDLSDVRGVRNLMRSPKIPLKEVLDTLDISGIDVLFNDSRNGDFDQLLNKKPLRTYSRSPVKKQIQQDEIDNPEVKEHVLEWVAEQSKIMDKATPETAPASRTRPKRGRKEVEDSKNDTSATKKVKTAAPKSSRRKDPTPEDSNRISEPEVPKLQPPKVLRTRRGQKQVDASLDNLTSQSSSKRDDSAQTSGLEAQKEAGTKNLRTRRGRKQANDSAALISDASQQSSMAKNTSGKKAKTKLEKLEAPKPTRTRRGAKHTEVSVEDITFDISSKPSSSPIQHQEKDEKHSTENDTFDKKSTKLAASPKKTRTKRGQKKLYDPNEDNNSDLAEAKTSPIRSKRQKITRSKAKESDVNEADIPAKSTRGRPRKSPPSIEKDLTADLKSEKDNSAVAYKMNDTAEVQKTNRQKKNNAGTQKGKKNEIKPEDIDPPIEKKRTRRQKEDSSEGVQKETEIENKNKVTESPIKKTRTKRQKEDTTTKTQKETNTNESIESPIKKRKTRREKKDSETTNDDTKGTEVEVRITRIEEEPKTKKTTTKGKKIIKNESSDERSPEKKTEKKRTRSEDETEDDSSERRTRVKKGSNKKYESEEWHTPVKSPKKKEKMASKKVTFKKDSNAKQAETAPSIDDGLRRSKRTRK